MPLASLARHSIRLALLGALLAPAGTAVAQQPPRVGVEVVVTHVAADAWRVDYTFDRPVTELVLGPPVAGFREHAWQVATPGVALVTRAGEEAIVAGDSARTRLSVTVHRYSEYASDSYVPVVPFTDGGAALYLPYLTGTVIVDGVARPLDARFRFVALPPEHVLAPAATAPSAYAYFGPQSPIASPHARLVVDPGAPAWLRDVLVEVGERATGVFARRLGGDLPVPPLVLVGAGVLDATDGVSVKGGAVGDQFVMLLAGRGLREESPRKREVLARLVAHELAHLWQLHMLPSAFSDAEPWLHEGSADAMAVQALRESGLWDATTAATYATQATQRCRTALGTATLPEAARAGSSDAVYACGFGLYWEARPDAMAAWLRLVRAVRDDGRPYTTATLDRVLAAPARR
jgi:hypothetical protein